MVLIDRSLVFLSLVGLLIPITDFTLFVKFTSDKATCLNSKQLGTNKAEIFDTQENYPVRYPPPFIPPGDLICNFSKEMNSGA